MATAAAWACARATTPPPRPPRPFLPRPPHVAREAVLHHGAVTVLVEIPTGFPLPRPAVISLLANRDPLLAAGAVAVSYRVDWERIKYLAPPTALAPPTPPGPNTVGQWVLASPSADVLGWRYLAGIVAEATIVVPSVLDYLAGVHEIDPTRLGIVGVSTTGFVALQATAADPRLVATAVLAACGDYETFLRYSAMGLGGTPLALAPDYHAWLHRWAPVHHPERLTHAAVLLVHRPRDHLIPVRCAQRTARAVRRADTRAGTPDRFRLILNPVPGHGIGDVERTAYVQWFQHWFRLP